MPKEEAPRFRFIPVHRVAKFVNLKKSHASYSAGRREGPALWP
jgi:hypothetical protein